MGERFERVRASVGRVTTAAVDRVDVAAKQFGIVETTMTGVSGLADTLAKHEGFASGISAGVQGLMESDAAKTVTTVLSTAGAIASIPGAIRSVGENMADYSDARFDRRLFAASESLLTNLGKASAGAAALGLVIPALAPAVVPLAIGGAALSIFGAMAAKSGARLKQEKSQRDGRQAASGPAPSGARSQGGGAGASAGRGRAAAGPIQIRDIRSLNQALDELAAALDRSSGTLQETLRDEISPHLMSLRSYLEGSSSAAPRQAIEAVTHSGAAAGRAAEALDQAARAVKAYRSST